MDVNYAVGTSYEESKALKELYYNLLCVLVEAFRTGDRALMVRPTLTGERGEAMAWMYDGEVECGGSSGCGGNRIRYVRDGESGAAAVIFCPNCWALSALDETGGRFASASRTMEAALRRLPPGCTITGLTIAGKKIELDHPIPNPYEPKN